MVSGLAAVEQGKVWRVQELIDRAVIRLMTTRMRLGMFDLGGILHDVFGEDIQIHIDPMYAVIAVHTGLGAVGVQFVKK